MENNNPKPIQLPELIASLEQATLMAKQLPSTTTDPSLLPQIYSSFHAAHHRLSSFLFSSDTNNNTNAAAAAAAAAEPMQFDVHDNDNQEADSKQSNNNDDDIMIDDVEERMRNCFIRNKRPKRALSPSYAAAMASAAEDERRSRGVGDGRMTGLALGFDPMETRLNALELVYQFHG